MKEHRLIQDWAIKHNIFLQGVIYLIGINNNGPIKIGWASDVLKCLSGLQVGCPDKLQLFAVLNEHEGMENILHMKFSYCKRRGEWFDISVFGIIQKTNLPKLKWDLITLDAPI